MTKQETLVKYLTDMHALENHLVQPLKSQAKDPDFNAYPAAQTFVQRMLNRSEGAVAKLETLAEGLGKDAHGTFKSAVTAAAGIVAAAINEGRTHHITKKLRDDYTALNLVSIGYELLHATANALGAPQIASFAQASLRETAALIMGLSQEIIPVAVAELAKTNENVDTASVATSQRNIKDAWTQH